MKTRLALVACLLALSGCYEAIQHQPEVDAGPACTSDEECACGERCEGADAGQACVPSQAVTCVDAHDCASMHCLAAHRLGHGCGYLECQP